MACLHGKVPGHLSPPEPRFTLELEVSDSCGFRMCWEWVGPVPSCGKGSRTLAPARNFSRCCLPLPFTSFACVSPFSGTSSWGSAPPWPPGAQRAGTSRPCSEHTVPAAPPPPRKRSAWCCWDSLLPVTPRLRGGRPQESGVVGQSLLGCVGSVFDVWSTVCAFSSQSPHIWPTSIKYRPFSIQTAKTRTGKECSSSR